MLFFHSAFKSLAELHRLVLGRDLPSIVLGEKDIDTLTPTPPTDQKVEDGTMIGEKGIESLTATPTTDRKDEDSGMVGEKGIEIPTSTSPTDQKDEDGDELVHCYFPCLNRWFPEFDCFIEELIDCVRDTFDDIDYGLIKYIQATSFMKSWLFVGISFTLAELILNHILLLIIYIDPPMSTIMKQITAAVLTYPGFILEALSLLNIWCWAVLSFFVNIPVHKSAVPFFIRFMAIGLLGCFMLDCSYGGDMKNQLKMWVDPSKSSSGGDHFGRTSVRLNSWDAKMEGCLVEIKEHGFFQSHWCVNQPFEVRWDEAHRTLSIEVEVEGSSMEETEAHKTFKVKKEVQCGNTEEERWM